MTALYPRLSDSFAAPVHYVGHGTHVPRTCDPGNPPGSTPPEVRADRRARRKRRMKMRKRRGWW